jgi:hypothetical protein
VTLFTHNQSRSYLNHLVLRNKQRLCSSPVHATGKRMYLNKSEWFIGLLVQESSLVFDRVVRMFCRCSVPTLSLFMIIIACFLQCLTNTRTELITDLFNRFRLRLADHQSQLRIAWGISFLAPTNIEN